MLQYQTLGQDSILNQLSRLIKDSFPEKVALDLFQNKLLF